MKKTKTASRPDKKLTRKTKIWIIVGSVVGFCIIGYLVYAYVVSNVFKECFPADDRCGIFPFEQELESECLMRSEDGSCKIYEVVKPIIYLYPESTTEVNVILGHPEKLVVSYPNYENGWHVLAEPSGRLTDLTTGKELYSLYWEGVNGEPEITHEGFVVSGSEVAEFLEEKLSILGLNYHEAEEFIVYWLPILQQNKYNYIRFATPEEISDYMPLQISPQPDTLIRVLMVTLPLDHPIELEEQVLPSTPHRTGFTVVEWGGIK